MTTRTHKPEPTQYAYRGHYICRDLDSATLTRVVWLVREDPNRHRNILFEGASVDDCMAAIDAVLDDA